jgi:cell division septum initiation protein DivIVA
MTQPSPAPVSGPQPVLAAPPVDKKPLFDAVVRGYDGRQVDGWVRDALAYIERLEKEGLTKAELILRAAAGSPQAQRSIADLMQLAADEITHNQGAAAREAAQVVADAEALAAQIKAAAEQEAAQVVSGAQEQANTVVQQAHAQGRALLDDASQKAAAVHQGAEARMAEVTRIHGETLRRLGEMNRVTGDLLHSEADRGSLADEVSRILNPPR